MDRAAHLMGVRRGPLDLPDSVLRMVEENGASGKAAQEAPRVLLDIAPTMEAKGEQCFFIVYVFIVGTCRRRKKTFLVAKDYKHEPKGTAS